MLLENVIISFPVLLVPAAPKGADRKRYGCTFLIPESHPQFAAVCTEYNEAVANSYPSGIPAGTDVCLVRYDEKYQGKSYYDPKFTGWWALTCTAPEDKPPYVLDSTKNETHDARLIISGALVHAGIGISGYTKGTGGVGGWLNGVMFTGQLGEQGRLDGRQSVDQMFASVSATATTPNAPVGPGNVPAGPTAPVPAGPTAVAPATQNTAIAPVAPAQQNVAPPTLKWVMTAKAQNNTEEQLLANGQGWTRELLIKEGMMIQSSVAN